MSNQTIKELITSIQQSFEKNDFDKFIHDATFPNFKKIKPFTKVEFKFPLTVLVGINGGGKSSMLHALWGMPALSSTSKFWFSTKIDPINTGTDTKPNPPRYWYTHYIKKINLKVQSRKVYPKKKERSWEPSRLTIKDGMTKMPSMTSESSHYMTESGDRWIATDKRVYYVNTKSETSAFDRFFYHTELTKLTDRQNFFIKKSEKLHAAIENKSTSVKIGRGIFSVEHIDISINNLDTINRILGKNYQSAKKILHELFDRNKSPSVIFETAAHTYSESFAGSGELAVVNLVLRVEELQQYDMLLIDEPETSLHPGAQTELMRYLLQKTKDKNLQIVIATHSPTIVDLMPECALVVLEDTTDGTIVNTEATKSTAFYRLGQPNPHKLTVITEDILLKAYVERALKYVPNDLQKRTEIWAANAGASEMLSHQIPAHMNTNSARVIMILDGDQSSFMSLISPDPDSLSPKDLLEFTEKLKECKVTIVGSTPDVPAYIRWCQKNILAIEYVCPEELFLSLLRPQDEFSNKTNKKYKDLVRKELNERGDDCDSKAQYTIFKSKLGEAINADKGGSGLVVKRLKAFAKKLEIIMAKA